ncbi:MAG: hypothetical protein KME20_16205 [Kaiparowitsia implicata GSE-PSE-MK54-09C]|jgi:hypothetical protein|nr:hypothetical protein [Kaiparowitsia implicata GSE-PSE-MK54-09C]
MSNFFRLLVKLLGSEQAEKVQSALLVAAVTHGNPIAAFQQHTIATSEQSERPIPRDTALPILSSCFAATVIANDGNYREFDNYSAGLK